MTGLSRFERWVYGEAPAQRLGLLRVAVGGYWLYRLWDTRQRVASIVRVDPEHFKPVGVATLLEGPISGPTFDLLWDLGMVFAALWTLGFAWRLVGPVFAGLLLFLMSYRLSWGQLHHEAHLPTLHALALAFAPCAAAVSLDSAIRRRVSPSAFWWALGSVAADTRPSWRWSWPVRLVCIVTVCSYVSAGIAKMTGDAGLAWVAPANLLNQVGYTALHQDFLASGGLPSVRFLYEHRWLVAPMGVLTILVEAGAFVALLHPRIAAVWVAGILATHWGIRMVMGIVFPYPLSGVAYLSFFPLERLLSVGTALRGLRRARPPAQAPGPLPG